jgi:hypothetical protein
MADLVKIERQRPGGDASRLAERRESLIVQLERIYGELDGQPAAGSDRA